MHENCHRTVVEVKGWPERVSHQCQYLLGRSLLNFQESQMDNGHFRNIMGIPAHRTGHHRVQLPQAPVSNCHKHPAWEFRRELLTVEDITDRWDDIVKAFPDKHFIFTVSPIRHRKDGMHGNQISKAILLLAVEHMVSAFPNTHYFPAYEIVLDELRDYSWFTDDLTHPSPEAVNIVWERFRTSVL